MNSLLCKFKNLINNIEVSFYFNYFDFTYNNREQNKNQLTTQPLKYSIRILKAKMLIQYCGLL